MSSIQIAPVLPQFPKGYDYIRGTLSRLQKLSNGMRRTKGIFTGPQFFRTQVSKNTCQTIDTFEVVEKSLKQEPNGRITAELYDILSGKFLFSVYDNASSPAPELIPLDYDSSYYDDLILCNQLPEHENFSTEEIYYLTKSRAQKKSNYKWLDGKSEPCFFKAMFQRRNDYLHTNFLTKVMSYKDIVSSTGIEGFSIIVYSLGHKEHRLSYFLDGSTKIERNVHL